MTIPANLIRDRAQGRWEGIFCQLAGYAWDLRCTQRNERVGTRMCLVRQNVENKGEENTSGKTLTLFNDEYENEWRYNTMSTDLPFEDAVIWKLYRQRANCENQIKELKQDFGLNSYVMRDFWATEAGLTTNVLAYNLVSLFRRLVLRVREQHMLSTIQRRFINIAGIFQESATGGKPTCRLAIQCSRAYGLPHGVEQAFPLASFPANGKFGIML